MAGPDPTWTDNHDQGVREVTSEEADLDQEQMARLYLMQTLDAEGVFTPIARASLPLQVTIRSHILRNRLQGGDCSLPEALEHLASLGHRGLSEEASWLLDSLPDEVRAGWHPLQGDLEITKNIL